MNQPSVPSTPEDRQKLLDLNSGETSATSADPNRPDQESQESEEVKREQTVVKGSPEKGAVHVNPIGENWEVENDAGTLGQAETKEEAVELAKNLAKESGAPKVTVHGSDGSVAQEMPTK